ncbi:TPA: hypothetical protein ACNUVO_003026 [Aeromonas salmonicida subsp. pectinolytica]
MNSSVVASYERLKRIADKEYIAKSYNSALKCISVAAGIANYYNFRYEDSDLEFLCKNIGKDFFEKKTSEFKIFSDLDHFTSKIVFYDCFAYDSRGLTQQYIRAIKHARLPFVFILNSDQCLTKNPDIKNELLSCANAKIIDISKIKSPEAKLFELISLIKQLSPSHVFLHMKPNDAVGVAAWSCYDGAKRYQINLTDHAFWLGTSCLDYLIEFRSYGAQISSGCRGVHVDKILHLPFYPITTSNDSFEEFPNVSEEIKIKIFSGGALYKFDGDNGEYFNLMKRVLDENHEVGLFIAGDGNRRTFNKFVMDNNYHNRVFMLGNRNNISSIFKNIDIYVGSYPISGGLMSQLAAEYNVPLIQYTREDLPINIIETLFPLKNKNIQLTFFDKDDFYQELRKLIKDKEYRQIRALSLKNTIMNKLNFNESFKVLIENPESMKLNSINSYNISQDILNEIYFEAAAVQSTNFMNRFLPTLYSLLKNDFTFFVIVLFGVVKSRKNLFKIISILKGAK